MMPQIPEGEDPIRWFLTEGKQGNDVYYAEHVSFLLDCRIIIMTLKSVLRRENVYKN